jgi:hypothetical protein
MIFFIKKLLLTKIYFFLKIKIWGNFFFEYICENMINNDNLFSIFHTAVQFRKRMKNAYFIKKSVFRKLTKLLFFLSSQKNLGKLKFFVFFGKK